MTVDVAVAGAVNQTPYSDRANAAMAADPRLAALAEMLQRALPSTNVDGRKIVDYDDADKVLDARSLWIKRHAGDLQAGLRAFEESQGEVWLPRRQGFEDLWQNGRSFIYGAANPGHDGVGANYGPFCLIISPTRLVGAHRGIFPGNTAERYGRGDGTADVARAHADAGCWEFAADVGVVEFAAEAGSVAPEKLPTHVCNDKRFLEIVLAGPVEFSEVIEVRISKENRRKLNGWSIQERAGTLTDPGMRWGVAAWRIVRQWAASARPHIALRIV